MRAVLLRPWWAIVIGVWVIIGIYATVVDQFVPESIAEAAPTAFDVAYWFFGRRPNLPVSYWLCGALGLILVFTFEAAFREVRKRDRTIESFGVPSVAIEIPAPVGLFARVIMRNTGAGSSFRISVHVVSVPGDSTTGLGARYIAPWFETTKPDQDIPAGGCGVIVLARQGSLLLASIEGAKRFRDAMPGDIVAQTRSHMEFVLKEMGKEGRSGALLEILECSPDGPKVVFSFLSPSHVVLELHAHSSLALPLTFSERFRVSTDTHGIISVSREVATQ